MFASIYNQSSRIIRGRSFSLSRRGTLSKDVASRLAKATFLLVCIAFLFLTTFYFPSSSSSTPTPYQKHSYRGPQYWKQGMTKAVETVYETPFARFQIHQVQLQDSRSTLIKDWLWYDEGDHVNVLVQVPNGDYLVFQQEKYGIPETTLAVVGGFIEPGESALQAAQREMQEELDMVATEWVELGSFRTAANRGGGTLYAFLARGAVPTTSAAVQTRKAKSVADGELERQDMVYLKPSELLEALLKGRFQEVKWTATIALALLKTKGSVDNS